MELTISPSCESSCYAVQTDSAPLPFTTAFCYKTSHMQTMGATLKLHETLCFTFANDVVFLTNINFIASESRPLHGSSTRAFHSILTPILFLLIFSLFHL